MLTNNVPTVVSAACVLHNVCEIHGESLDESWASNDASSDTAQPDRYPTDNTAVNGFVAIGVVLMDYHDN